MARIVETFTADAGRDKGKVFILTEMSPRAGHDWACRALFCMGAAGAKISDHIAKSGLSGLAFMGLDAFMGGINPETGRALLDELLNCVTINHVPENPAMARKLFIDDDIEEIATIFNLQKAVFMLHTAPFTSAVRSISDSKPQEAAPN
jgi:hypothetical protein